MWKKVTKSQLHLALKMFFRSAFKHNQSFLCTRHLQSLQELLHVLHIFISFYSKKFLSNSIF